MMPGSISRSRATLVNTGTILGGGLRALPSAMTPKQSSSHAILWKLHLQRCAHSSWRGASRLRVMGATGSGSSASPSTLATHWGPSGRSCSTIRSTSALPGSERRKPIRAWMRGRIPDEKTMVIASSKSSSSTAALMAASVSAYASPASSLRSPAW